MVDAAGNELRALLAPVTPQEFVHEYWGKKPLYVKGFKDKYKGFFDAAMFSRALTAPGAVAPDFLRASFDRKTEAGTSAMPNVPTEHRSSAFRANLDQAVALFDAGATLCVSQIETRAVSLAPFVAAIKRQLGYPCRVSFNAYLSPPGSGYNWHFDSRIASTLQIEGTKTWRFSNKPAMPWPRANGSIRADGVAQYADPNVTAQEWERLEPFDEKDTTEVLLEPGDLLILPAGIWHEACGGTGGSLALNLAFTPIPYTMLIGSVLDALLTPDPEWRSPTPLLPGANPGELDPQGVATISAQLVRAAVALESLSGDSAAVVRIWQSMVRAGTPATMTPPVSPTPVTPTQRLRVNGSVNAMLADNGTRLFLAVGANGSLELTGPAVQFVQLILAEHEFNAGDCLTWNVNGESFQWNDVQTLLTNLKREDLIREI
ncbi:MAG TPA: cupin domain-containing protein [Candidatus Baltobacteraceae bacterium]|nr:cupin domain-containing protein [Candidatus Baltobacteraceae bacterium]